jgi:dTDP-4-amino-4,6-dideoxygalactose transaminase
MINWLSNKKINNKKVNKLLQISLKENKLTNYGPNVQLLENIIRDKFKINENKAIICVANGSVALHSLSSAINYFEKKNIKWATQSFTFPPSAQSNLNNVKIIITTFRNNQIFLLRI